MITEFELYNKLRAALESLETYQSEKRILNYDSPWASDIKDALKDIATRTKVLGAAGPACKRCHGSGVEP